MFETIELYLVSSVEHQPSSGDRRHYVSLSFEENNPYDPFHGERVLKNTDRTLLLVSVKCTLYWVEHFWRTYDS